MTCEQCGKELTGRELRFCSDPCRERFWTEARKRGAALGKGLDALLPGKGNGKRKGKIHAALVIGNPRLEPIMLAIQARKKMTSLELHELTGSMAIHSDIAEIRERGYPISPAKYVGKSAAGRKIYEYSWEA